MASPTDRSMPQQAAGGDEDPMEDIRDVVAENARRINRTKYHIPEDMWAPAVNGLRALTERLRLTLDMNTAHTPYGNKPISENTKKTYDKHLRGACLIQIQGRCSFTRS
jgi:hypothetical protein